MLQLLLNFHLVRYSVDAGVRVSDTPFGKWICGLTITLDAAGDGSGNLMFGMSTASLGAGREPMTGAWGMDCEISVCPRPPAFRMPACRLDEMGIGALGK